MLNGKKFAAAAIVTVAGLAFAPGVYAGPIIVNGSFEAPGGGSSFVTLPSGSTAITGWTVGGAGIDYIGAYWAASNGSSSLDLNALAPGSISQTITGLTVGATYRVGFDMAGNPDGGPTIKSLEVDLNGIAQDTATFDTTGKSHSAMGWTSMGFNFTATNISELLAFVSTTSGFSGNDSFPGAFGPALDNVSINSVPEPLTLSIFGAGLAGMATLRRRKRVKMG